MVTTRRTRELSLYEGQDLIGTLKVGPRESLCLQTGGANEA
jgi:hypothetical protein